MPKPVWLPLSIAALLLAGCAGQPEASVPPAFSVEKVAEVPLGLQQGFITAPATIEQRPATMLVDTGSERTIVTPGAVADFGLQPDPHAHTRIQGTGGTVMADHARLNSFGIGGMEMLDQSYAVEDLPRAGRPGDYPAGLLGADWLSDYDIDLDIGHRRMVLYRVEGCADDHVPWGGPRAVMRTIRYGRGLVLVRLVVDGTPVIAVLDSGADRSVLSEAAANRIGVSAGALARDASGRGGGVDGRVAVTHLHRFATVQIGAERIGNMQLYVGPLQAPGGAEMLLGVDWLSRNRVWIDYRDHTISFQPLGAAHSPVRTG
jgi:predicted aspartyl protease